MSLVIFVIVMYISIGYLYSIMSIPIPYKNERIIATLFWPIDLFYLIFILIKKHVKKRK